MLATIPRRGEPAGETKTKGEHKVRTRRTSSGQGPSMVDRLEWPDEDTHIFMTNGVRFELRDGYSVDEVVGQGAYGMVCSGAYRGRAVAVKVSPRATVAEAKLSR